MYNYTCPECGEELEFRKRVTITKRRCPFCNELITPREIDRQAAEVKQRQIEALRQRLVRWGIAWAVLTVIIAIGGAVSGELKTMYMSPIWSAMLLGIGRFLFHGFFDETRDRSKRR